MKFYRVLALALALGTVSPVIGALCKYVDFTELILTAGRRAKDGVIDSSAVVVTIFRALKIGQLPLRLPSGRSTTYEEFFEIEKLKECVSLVLEKSIAGKLRKGHLIDALELLQESMKEEAFQRELPGVQWFNLKRSLEVVIKYINENPVHTIRDAINLERVPPFFGFVFHDYFIMDVLHNALSKALSGIPLTTAVLLDCIDIRKIAINCGYQEIPDPEGIRAALEAVVLLFQNDSEERRRVFNRLADDRQRRDNNSRRGSLVSRRHHTGIEMTIAMTIAITTTITIAVMIAMSRLLDPSEPTLNLSQAL
jgi:hypothetical protein